MVILVDISTRPVGNTGYTTRSLPDSHQSLIGGAVHIQQFDIWKMLICQKSFNKYYILKINFVNYLERNCMATLKECEIKRKLSEV